MHEKNLQIEAMRARLDAEATYNRPLTAAEARLLLVVLAEVLVLTVGAVEYARVAGWL